MLMVHMKQTVVFMFDVEWDELDDDVLAEDFDFCYQLLKSGN